MQRIHIPEGDQHLAAADIPNRIRRLRDFLGGVNVDKALGQYALSLRSSGPIYAEYFLKSRHPWWQAWADFEEIKRAGKRLSTGLPMPIKALGNDAHMISVLQATMPQRVREKYRCDLLVDGASNYLFELRVAWAFHTENFKIRWNEGSGCEFAVLRDDRSLNVECKAVACDSARKIKRSDFYRLLDGVVPRLIDRSWRGHLDVELEGPLPHHEVELTKIGNEIIEKVRVGTGRADCSFGVATWDFASATGKPVDAGAVCQTLWSRKPPEAEGAVFVGRKDGQDIVIEITVQSRKASNVLMGIRERLSDAGKRQLLTGEPGMLACHIPEVPVLDELGGDTALTAMVQELFLNEKLRHVVAIVFSSEPRVSPVPTGQKIETPALGYANRKTPYVDAARDVARAMHFDVSER